MLPYYVHIYIHDNTYVTTDFTTCIPIYVHAWFKLRICIQTYLSTTYIPTDLRLQWLTCVLTYHMLPNYVHIFIHDNTYVMGIWTGEYVLTNCVTYFLIHALWFTYIYAYLPRYIHCCVYTFTMITYMRRCTYMHTYLGTYIATYIHSTWLLTCAYELVNTYLLIA